MNSIISNLEDEINLNLNMEDKGLKEKVANGVIWITFERFGVQALSFVVTLVLARLLTPADYGVVAVLTVFTSVASTLVTSGMGTALVQKKEATEVDFNTVFYVSLLMSLILYVILFFAAPFIADFYSDRQLIPILRVISISLFFIAINSVQIAELNRKMLFRLRFNVSVIASLVSAVAGISFALLNYGPWALALQSVLSGFASVVAYWFIIAWRPKLMFSMTSFKSLFGYGWRIASVSIIYNLYLNLYALIIGKVYSKEDLAYVNKGKATPYLAMNTISGTICGVSFPALAKVQDSPRRLKNAVSQMIKCSYFFVLPLMILVGVCAHDLVSVMFGEKWLPCVPYMQLACVNVALRPLHDINLQTISAIGRADVFFKLELIKDAVGVLCVFVFLRYSVFIFMLALTVISGPVALVINAWNNKRFINYPLIQQLKDISPIAGASIPMILAVLLIQLIWNTESIVIAQISKLIVQGALGFIIFGLSAYLCKIEALCLCMNAVQPTFGRRCPRIMTVLSRLITNRYGEKYGCKC